MKEAYPDEFMNTLSYIQWIFFFYVFISISVLGGLKEVDLLYKNAIKKYSFPQCMNNPSLFYFSLLFVANISGSDITSFITKWLNSFQNV